MRMQVYAVVVLPTYEVQDARRVGLFRLVLDIVQETLASLARPSGSGMSSLGLLATQVLAKVLDRDGLVAEPKVALGKLEAPAS